MECTKFEDLLFVRLDADLGDADEAALREHAQQCRSCRRLSALLEAGDGPADELPPVPEELLPEVIEQTSGTACDRVASMLAESLDARLDAPFASAGTLLAAHVDRCPDCAALARALTRLHVELPRLAAIDPGEAFTTAVLAATSNREREASPPTVAPGARFEAVWTRLVRRPRFALEGAYAAALLIFLVAGVPSTSAAELPVRVFDELRRETARVEETLSSGVGAAVARGREAVSGAAERAARILAPEQNSEMTAENPFASRDAAVASAARAWAGAREMVSAIWNGILGPFAERVGSLWFDAPSDEAPEDIALIPTP